MKKQSPTLGQNRIDYIVYHNTAEVSKLLEAYGFEVPEHPKHLAEAIKALARKKGRKVIKALIKLHPDTQAILSISKPNENTLCEACNQDAYNTEGNICKSCGHSNYAGAGDEENFMRQFEDYKDQELERYYQSIVKKSNTNPQDKNLAQEVQLVWNAIRTRKLAHKQAQATPPESSKRFSITKDELLLLGVVFIAGALVGHGLNFNFSNVK